MKNRFYYESMDMALYALEGHTQKEVADEFEVGSTTVRKRINFLAETNPNMYQKVMECWHGKNSKFEGKLV